MQFYKRDVTIIAMWNAGKTSRAIGAELGIDAATVRRRLVELRRAGLPVITYEEARARRPGEITKDELLAALEDK